MPQAIEAADAVPYYQDYELDTYTFMGSGIQEITGYLPQELNPRIWESLILDMQLTGDLAGMTDEEAVRSVSDGHS